MPIAMILNRIFSRASAIALLGLLFLASTLFTASAQNRSAGAAKRPPTKSKESEERRRREKELTEKYRNSLTPEKIRQQQEGPTVVLPLVKYDTSESLTELARMATKIEKEGGVRFEAHTEELIEVPDDPSMRYTPAPLVEAFLQSGPAAPSVLVPGISFEGPGSGINLFNVTGTPPDTTMAVGPNHIVAWVNSQFMIFNKLGVPQGAAPFFLNGSTIWAGFGGVCQTTNRGDPLVAYDRVANRWVFSQFAFNTDGGGNPITPYRQCFAVTTGPDPAGPYNRYEYSFDTAGAGGTPSFNDYGKLGVWNDGYYVGYNQFGGSPAGANTGAAMCAYDRLAMIAGTAADGLCAPVTFYAGGASLFPFDNEGPVPPTDATRGGAFIRHSTAAELRIIRLLPNYTTNTVTVTNGYGGATGSFVSLPVVGTRACNGNGNNCIPQPGTATLLDSLGDRLMYRPAFRNRGGVESLVVTQSVDADPAPGVSRADLRWYEIRNPLNNPADPVVANRPVVFQNSTFAPDATHRWMGSAAMNSAGDIFLGYSRSSSTIFPGLGAAVRQIGDPLNTLQSEVIAHAGAGSQTTFSNGTPLTRWGDYTTAQVDPSDDRTFWFIGQYLAATGAFNWRTRVVSFSIPTGATPTVTNVTSSTIDGAYNVPDVVSIQVTFSESVTVLGVPQLTLETGAADAVVNYTSGSPGTTLTFNYTVAAGQNSADLNYQSTSALATNGGTINSTAGGSPANLTLPALAGPGSLATNKNIIIDTTAPTATSAPGNVTVAGGTNHPIVVNFADNTAIDVSDLDSLDVRVTNTGAFNTPATFVGVDTNTDGTPRQATYGIVPPGGSWDNGDNGTYSVQMQATQVTDTAENPVATSPPALGTFTVNVPAGPCSTVVTTTADTGAGSLREAINCSNTTAGVQTISFNITPLGGLKTITPATALPPVSSPAIIDGYTQSGSSPNTNATGALNTVLTVEIDGSGTGVGLDLSGGSSTVRGLVVNGWDNVGIRAITAGGNIIQGNFIGTNAAGTAGLPNGFGVALASSNNTVGGVLPAERNLISNNDIGNVFISGATASGNIIRGNLLGTNAAGTGALTGLISSSVIIQTAATNNVIGGTTAAARNVISGSSDGSGISLSSAGAGNSVQGNYIGTDVTGTSALPNQVGVNLITTSGSSIGGTAAGESNLIAFNTGQGISFGASGTGNRFLSNSIHSNGLLGIDLGTVGVMANDANDADSGPNNLQNFPVLTSAIVAGGSTTVTGTLNSGANTTFRIEFFSNPSCDALGNGEGRTFLDAVTITTVGNNAAISAVLPIAVTTGHAITATATDPANNTSEFSACVAVAAPTPTPTPTATPTPTPTPTATPTPTPTPTATPTPTPTPTPPPSISGTVSYGITPVGQATKFVQGVALAGSGSVSVNGTTNGQGSYSLSGFGGGPYTVTPSKTGDVNSISALDASRVAQHAAGLTVLTSNQILAGDATNNGVLSALDASRIAQFAAGIPNPGIAGQWKFSPASKTYPSVANPSGENYDAILVGEVTGNWTPPAAPGTIKDSDPGIANSSTSSIVDRLIWNRDGDKSGEGIYLGLPATATTGTGKSLTLPIPIGDTTGKGIVAYQFTLDFDPNIINPTLDPVTTSGTLSEGWSVIVNSQTRGRITVLAYSTHELNGSGTLLNLSFTVARAAGRGATPLKWLRFEINENELVSALLVDEVNLWRSGMWQFEGFESGGTGD